MNQSLLKSLKEWRYAQAAKEQVECFKILHNKTLLNIAEAMPQTRNDLLNVKGIGDKTCLKYGRIY
jgi:superfamily II DNA helicase RecQ